MTTTATPAALLRQIALTWPQLTTALEDGTTGNWPPAGRMTDYLAALDDTAAAEQRYHRARHRLILDRDPAQLGTTRPPLSIHVHDTIRTIETALAGCADVIASKVQTEPIPAPGRDWPTADRARRAAASRADIADPRRWRFRGRTPRAPYTALWLLARVECRPGPFRPLIDADRRYIGGIAREAIARMDVVLGLSVTEVRHDAACPDCAGPVTVRTEAGDPPTARCAGDCGRVWTLADAAAA
ncbi:hypothetical protein [Streptomyces goshikiensis]